MKVECIIVCLLADDSTAVDVDPTFTYGMAGRVRIDPKAIRANALYKSPIPDEACPDIQVRDAEGLV